MESKGYKVDNRKWVLLLEQWNKTRIRVVIQKILEFVVFFYLGTLIDSFYSPDM